VNTTIVITFGINRELILDIYLMYKYINLTTDPNDIGFTLAFKQSSDHSIGIQFFGVCIKLVQNEGVENIKLIIVFVLWFQLKQSGN